MSDPLDLDGIDYTPTPASRAPRNVPAPPTYQPPPQMTIHARPEYQPPAPVAPPGYVYNPRTNAFDPIPPVPRAIPMKKPSLLPWIFAGLSFLGFLVLAGFVLWFIWPDDGGGRRPVQPIEASNPAEYFIENYRQGLSELYADASDAAANGDFKDIVEARDFVKAGTEKVKARSFDRMKTEIESINGEKWDNNRAADIYERFSEGFAR